MVTTEGVSCITTQTNSNYIILFFDILKGIHGFHNWTVVNDSRVCLKESREWTKNEFLGYFWEFSDFGVFWKVLSN